MLVPTGLNSVAEHSLMALDAPQADPVRDQLSRLTRDFKLQSTQNQELQQEIKVLRSVRENQVNDGQEGAFFAVPCWLALLSTPIRVALSGWRAFLVEGTETHAWRRHQLVMGERQYHIFILAA